MFNSEELKHAKQCKGDCFACSVSKHTFCSKEFGCTRAFAGEVSVLSKKNAKLKKSLVDLLKIVKPMVEDWSCCPVCHGSWDEHSETCELQSAVEAAKKHLM